MERDTYHVTFAHEFYQKGDASKLQSQHVAKIRMILARLDAAKTAEELNVPGYGLHQLNGDLKDFWSVKVDKKYRIIFCILNEHVEDVDYIDYH